MSGTANSGQLTKWEDFRFIEPRSGLFVAEHEGEIHHISHNRNDHNGFGGAVYNLHMADEWDASTFRPCSRTERRWMSMESTMEVSCGFDSVTRILRITGPWHGGASGVSAAYKPVVDISTLEGPSREAIRNPRRYERRRRAGHRYEGTAIATTYTLEFAREAIDRLAPHLELYEGDFGWYVKLRDMSPNNPRRGIGGDRRFLSDEQAACVYR